MKKNTASQSVGVQMVSATDGSAFTGAVTVYVTGDAGTQAIGSVSSGACTHEGNGYHTYAPAQAETNYDQIGFTFIGTGAIPQTITVYTTFPQTGDSFARLGAPSGASVSADISTVAAYIDTEVSAIKAKTDNLPASPAAVGDIPSAATIADAVWDENIATHQTVNSAGRAVTIAGTPLSETTAAGVPTTTTLPLTAGSAVDDFYNDLMVLPASGSLSGQARIITDYVGATKTITVDEPWTSAISAGDAVVIIPRHTHTKNQIRDAILSDSTPFAGANINATISSRLASASYTAPLDAAGTRTAIGLASANLDTQLTAIDDYLDTEIAAIKAKTDNLPADPADASDIAASFSTVNGTLATIAAYIDTEVSAIKAKTDNLPASPAAVGDIPTAAQNATAVLTTQMTESYAADGVAPTLAQAVLLTQQSLTEMSIAGTTMTVKKLNGLTTAATLTLDSSTAPTSITRAT